MTTIAVKDGVMCSDSQGTSSFILPCGIKKIYRVGDNHLGFSGSFPLVEKFLDWYKGSRERDLPGNELCVLEMDHKGNVTLFNLVGGEVSSFSVGKYYAIGSGQDFAMGAMEVGASAEEAVKAAIKLDPDTGGRVKKVYKGC